MADIHVLDLPVLLDELERERIENAHLREAFMTMEKAYNEAHAVLDTACPILTLMSTEDHAVLSVDRAAWLAWQGRQR